MMHDASCPGVQDVVLRGVYQRKSNNSLFAPSTLLPGSQQGTAEIKVGHFLLGHVMVEDEPFTTDTSSK